MHSKKKARGIPNSQFSDSDLSHSADSYSTRRSQCRTAKLHQTTSKLATSTNLAVHQHHFTAPCLPLVLTKDPAMTSLTTATTDQSSLTSTMGDQLLMIKQQFQELDELKENMNVVQQDLGQYQSSHMLMAQNLQPLHSTVMEVAQAMTMMTSKLNQVHIFFEFI